MWRITYFVAIALFLGVVSSVVPSGAAILVWSLVAGAASLLSVRFTDDRMGDTVTEVAAMTVAGGATLFGWVLKLVHQSTNWIDGIGVVVAMGCAWALDTLTTTDGATPCSICKQPAGDQPFTCPRCHRAICARPTCWIARHARCQRCHELEVVFPATEPWWKSQVGQRVTTGSCSGACMREAYETDLRACPRCRYPFCKRCWDHQNFTCTHCGWVMPDLPKALAPFVAASPPATRRPDERISGRRR